MLNGVVVGRYTTEIWFEGCEGSHEGSLTAVVRIPSSSTTLSTKRVFTRFLRDLGLDGLDSCFRLVCFVVLLGCARRFVLVSCWRPAC
jgi:hypothetical protein